MPSYRFELATSARAGCVNTECKKNNVKIGKGELRQGVWVEIPGTENASFKWKHWGCVTPQQLHTIWETAEHDLDLIDGYDDLPTELQDKLKRALEQGHVDDEDWKGDVEKNRPGEKGFRKPTPKKKAPKKTAEDDEEAADAPSPTKAAPKKRSRAKKDEDGAAVKDEEDEPPAKKAKAPRKRKAAADDEVEEPVAAPKEPKSSGAAAPKAKAKASKATPAAAADPVEKTKRAPRKKKSVEEVEEALDVEEPMAEEVAEEEKPKKGGRKKKEVPAAAEVAPPVKRTRKAK